MKINEEHSTDEFDELFALAENYEPKKGPVTSVRPIAKYLKERPKDVEFIDTGLIDYAPNEREHAYGAITEKRLENILPYIEAQYEHWLAYPDKMIEDFLPKDTSFKILPFQVLSLRANARHKRVFETAPRGFSKSFKAILSKMLKCSLLPNSKEAMLAANKIQAARIGKEKIEELFRLLPFLKHEVDFRKGSGTTFGKDYIHIRFKNNSEFDIVSILESERGGRRHGLIISPFVQKCA